MDYKKLYEELKAENDVTKNNFIQFKLFGGVIVGGDLKFCTEGLNAVLEDRHKEIEILKKENKMLFSLLGIPETESSDSDEESDEESDDSCVICGEEDIGYGNNAMPVKEGQCCNHCNTSVVMPARIGLMCQ